MRRIIFSGLGQCVSVSGNLTLSLVLISLLGPHGSGQFYFLLAIIAAFSTLSRFGSDTYVLRAGGRFLSDRSTDFFFVIRGVLRLVACIFLFLVLPLTVFLIYFENTPYSRDNVADLVVIPVLLLGHIGCFLVSSLIKSLRMPVRSYFFEFGACSLYTSVALIFLDAIEITATVGLAVAIMSALSIVVSSIGALIVVEKATTVAGTAFSFSRAKLRAPNIAFRVRDLNYFAGASLAAYALSWGPILIIGFSGNTENVAVYTVCQKLAQLISFPLLVIGSIGAPMFSNLYHEGKLAELETLFRDLATVTFIVSFSLAGTLLVAYDLVVSVVIDEMPQEAFMIVLILSCAYVASSFFGSAGFLLSMTGYQRERMRIVLFTSGLAMLVGYIANQHTGALGVAIAFSACLAAQNVGYAAVAHSKHGILAFARIENLSRTIRRIGSLQARHKL